MTRIIELAHALGEEIAKSDEIKNLEASKDAYEKDAELQAKLSEYETERKLLGEEFSKNSDDVDENAVANLRARIEELTKIIFSLEDQMRRDFSATIQLVNTHFPAFTFP